MLHSYASWEKTVLAATAIKTLYVATGILLTAGNLVAATSGLVGWDNLQTTLYEIMIPFGEASIGAAVILMSLISTSFV